MAVSKRLRYEVLRRDNHACRYCGASAPEAKLVVDHVIAVALGGSDEPSNLVAACEPCNSGKSATPADAAIVDDVQADALRWGAAMAKAAAVARANLRERRGYRDDFAMFIWAEWTYEHKGERCVFALPRDWEASIDRFLDAGINMDDFREAVHIAMVSRARDKFPYMCGVLWNWISERQQIAMEIVSGEPDSERLCPGFASMTSSRFTARWMACRMLHTAFTPRRSSGARGTSQTVSCPKTISTA